jgi:hypothetical protein
MYGVNACKRVDSIAAILLDGPAVIFDMFFFLYF